ncbi:peptide transporter ptr2 [Coemansia sp. RSA 989]|nr:POT family-domain-containing protein [Coemansia mojavensis]KAJ1738299.1 peptide transporter ptr2 [Coemansia sp. RSA 1086]KAJ1752062.1 peptide transporter ptr2 [Coemansia sp. RSA 1821]KAJ1867421.1 peptide transporter ptr2 [Coemansia sp. RSA 989]KAJ1874923.1 peptide transporter ptr2 [Coemansia sp. RSA 990]KAJ2671527.1 peptide transporter ptr2 [Coemansia sp. RSA 1085]
MSSKSLEKVSQESSPIALQDEELHPEHFDDYLRDGERWATEEDMSMLRRVGDRIPTAAFFVVLTEFCERFTYYGITGPFQNYIQNGYRVPNSNPGAIGGGQHLATGLSNFFQFWCYLTPILGAVIADQYLGKFKTIVVFSIIYIVGDLILTLTSIPASIRHGGALPGLVIAMITIGLGTGGIKSNVSPMVAEQYGRYRPFVRTLKNGTQVVVDRELTVQSIFNWFYWAINVGGLSAIATTELEANVDFWPAYLLPTLMFVVCVVVFVLGRKKYVITKPTGSIVVKAYKVFVTGVRNYRRAKAENRLILDEDGKKISWMDYAKPSLAPDGGAVGWTDKFVDELRTALRSCKVMAIYPLFWLCYNQMSNNMVSQAGQMNTGSVPNDIMQNIDPLCIIILIPIFDRLVFPGFRRMGLELRPVTRITIGFLVAALAMAYAAILQHFVYKTGPYFDAAGDGDNGFNHISAAIQVPAYILIAISEIFASVTGLEYAYKRAPESMKSIVMSIFLFTNAGGSILGFCFNSISANPHLVKNFAIVSGLMGAGTIVFFICFRHYDNREAEELKKNTVFEKESPKVGYAADE